MQEAAWRFAPTRFWREYVELDREQGPAPDLSGLPLVEAIGRTLKPISDRMTARADILSHVRGLLLSKLHDGTLLATGFPGHVRNAYERVRVEPFLLQWTYVDWDHSRCKGLDRAYELVEVFRPTPARIAAPAPVTTKSREKRSVGRPNVRKLVVELAIELLDVPKPPRWVLRVDLHQLIRGLGKLKYSEHFDENRPGREVLRDGINQALKMRPDLDRPQKL